MTTASSKRMMSTAVCVALAAAFTVGCSSSGDDETTASTAGGAVSSTTVSTAPAAHQQVLAGYRAFWDAYLAAGDPMSPEDSRLLEHATGEELETVQKAFLARRSAGEVIRGTLELAPRVDMVGADGMTATIVDCYLDHTGVYDAATGARKDSESGVRHLIRVQMARVEGTWKAASVSLEADACTPAA